MSAKGTESGTPQGREVPLHVTVGPDGHPLAARSSDRINAPPAKVWETIEDVASYPRWVPMIHKVERNGDEVHVHLKFKVSLFSVGFDFHAAATRDPGKKLELRWVRGEPRDIYLAFELEPEDEGRATRLTTRASFDVLSLGWLVKFFLKHHPEIRYGIYPGIALTLGQELKRAIEAKG